PQGADVAGAFGRGDVDEDLGSVVHEQRPGALVRVVVLDRSLGHRALLLIRPHPIMRPRPVSPPNPVLCKPHASCCHVNPLPPARGPMGDPDRSSAPGSAPPGMSHPVDRLPPDVAGRTIVRTWPGSRWVVAARGGSSRRRTRPGPPAPPSRSRSTGPDPGPSR